MFCFPQVFHDAFFKYQTKPKLTSYGDLYYEGKEFEVRAPLYLADTIHESIYGSDAKFYLHIRQPKLKVMKPGMLSQELKKALGMPDGAPPPWVTRMQVCIF